MDLKQLETNLERRWDSLSPTGRQKMIDMIEKEKGKRKGHGGTPLAKKKNSKKGGKGTADQSAFNKHWG